MDSLNEQFGRIYDQYIDKIYRFIYFKVNSQEIAEDITSKVFLKGFEAFKNQQAGSSSVIKNQGAFLYQIARNAVIDYYREKGRSKSMSIDDAPQIADPGTSAHDKAVLNADVEAVKNAIKKLKKDYQLSLIHI